jgi:quercetin dioxygenase-like cupin family protein
MPAETLKPATSTRSQATRHIWSELAQDSPMAKITRKRIFGEKMMVSEVRLTKGFDLASHAHENEQFVVMLTGRCTFGLGAPGTPDYKEIELKGGEVLVLPGHVPHSCRALEDSHILDLFSPISETTGVDRH